MGAVKPAKAVAAVLTRGERNAAWIERHCVIPEGKHVGRRVKLTPEQHRWLRLIYDTPTRTFILSMARKNAKTAFTAFLLLLHLCGPEAVGNSQLYSAAQAKDQAALLFELAAKIVRMSETLSPFVRIRDTIKELVCGELGTVYKALSAEVSTSFGKSPVFLVHDELGQVRGPRSALYEALESACSAHDAPMSIIISTQAATDADLLSVLIDDAETQADPRTKLVLYKAVTEDETGNNILDPFGDVAIRQANPHFDVFMNQTEVRDQAEKAKRMPSREAGYRNLILNQRVETKNPLISRGVWSDNSAPPDDIMGKKVWAGLDLSSVSDLTALILVSEEGDIVPTFWLPERGLKEKSASDRVPYDLWHEKGLLETTPGAAIEYKYVAKHLRWVFDTYDIQKLAFDRYNMKFLKPWLLQEGFSEAEIADKFVEFGQGYVSMSPAIRELETRLLAKKMRHGGHPVLTMCAANAIAIKDDADNRKFTKKRASGRIDGMVALAMAVGVMPMSADDGDFMDFLSDPVTA
jgi:phage terminase large subunit-like protein